MNRDPLADPILAGLPRPEALLFDLDGTLVDTVQLRIAGWQEALRRSGIELDRDFIAAHIGADGRWLAREMGRAVGRDMDWAESDEIDRLSGSIFDEMNTAPQTLPGARELLTALEEGGFPFAIATASQPGQVAVSVAALALPSRPSITDAGHVEHAKPAPDLLLAAAAQLGLRPQDCWYVGDSTWDMMAAVRAEMTAVGVATGAADANALIAAGASMVLDNLVALDKEIRRRGLLA